MPPTSPAAAKIPSAERYEIEEGFPYVYVPQLVTDALWAQMDDVDKVFCITSVYKSLLQFSKQPVTEGARVGLCYAAGLSEILVKCCDDNYDVIGVKCYKEVFRLAISYRTMFVSEDTAIEALDQAEQA